MCAASAALLGAATTGAAADPGPVADPPRALCTVTDPRLGDLSGLVVVDDGPHRGTWAVDDDGSRTEVHRLDEDCVIVETRGAEINPFDSEDLALGPDGAFWVADIGDNRRVRDTVAMIVLPSAGEPRLHRLTYPDGPHDAEALIVDAEGIPHVITKDVGAAGVYRPDAAPTGIGPTPLRRVADVVLAVSDTEGGPLGVVGSRVVTGAAVTADGAVVALRTYTDAWLYPVPEGDVVAALRGTPVRVPLPDEPQGEAIAFDAAGTLFSASEARGARFGELRAVPGAADLVERIGRLDDSTTVDPPPVPSSPEWLPAVAGAALGVVLLGLAAVALARRH